MEARGDRNLYLALITIVGSIAVGALVARSMVALLVGVGIVLVVALPARWKVTLLILLSQMPPVIGRIAGIPDVQLIEILAIPMLALAVVASVRTGRPLVPRSARVVSVFVALFAAVAAYHAFGVGAGSLGNATGSPNTRAYVDLFLGVAIFFAVLYWSDAEEKWTDGPLIALASLGLTVGLLRLVVYMTGAQMPVFGGRFQYDVVTTVSGVSVARIGGLTEAASFAIGGAIGLWHRRRLPWLALLCGLAGVVFAIISGGRSYSIGLLAGLLVYATVLPGRRAWPRIVAMAIAAVLAAISVVALGLGAQLTRLSAFAGGIQGQDPARATAMRFQWVEFLNSPLVGKGIGAPGVGLSTPFVADIVSHGGHSAYLSTLANFGVVGLSSQVALLAGSIGRSWTALRRRTAPPQSPVSGWLALLLFVLVTRVFENTVGGDGYSDFALYAMAAAALAVRFGPSEGEVHA